MSAARRKVSVRGIWSRLSRFQKVTGMPREDAEDVLRGIVKDVSEQTSTRQLTLGQARKVEQAIEGLIRAEGYDPHARKGYRRASRRDQRRAAEGSSDMVTKEQSDALLRLAEAVGWNRERLRNWIKGHMASVCEGMPWPQTCGQAIKVHEGLEAILWRLPSSAPKAIVERCRVLLAAPVDLTPWESGFLRDLIDRHGQMRRDRTWRPMVKLAEIENKRRSS